MESDHLGMCATRLGLLYVGWLGIRRRDASVLVNALLSLLGTFIPTVLERRYPIHLRPWQRLWISVAMLMHAIGMLGTYDRIWWWDHVTHTLSASIVGAIAYVVTRTSPNRRGDHRGPPRATPTVVFGWTMGLGLLWEVLEYAIHVVENRLGLTPLLKRYGRRDTVLDLVFDGVGAALVIIFGPEALANVVESLEAVESVEE